MSEQFEPLPVRPAATVMLLRDTADGISVFLMRRHRAMEIRGRDDGVSRRRRRPTTTGTPRSRGTAQGGLVGRAVRCFPTSRRPWSARRRRGDLRGVRVLFAGPADDPTASSPTRRCTATRKAWRIGSLSFRRLPEQ